MKPGQADGARKPKRRKRETRAQARDRAGASDAPLRDLNRTNRRMRTRMSGGVGGERRSPTAAPYPDVRPAWASASGWESRREEVTPT